MPTAQTASLSLWNGSDEYSALNDRVDAPPLPLPAISEPVRVVIVRHGQSTWNAEGRIQGSTDLSVLTEKGVKQAGKTRDMLSAVPFTAVFQSPLARARQTADVVLQGRMPAADQGGSQPAAAPAASGDTAAAGRLPRVTLPCLREVDLYQFQGLLKHEGKALYGDAYKQWQRAPHLFELDGRAPVRELWYRGSLAWQALLQPQQPAAATAATAPAATASAGPAATAPAAPPQPSQPPPQQLLVVAHNAINQALVATALGLPPQFFRRLPQNNAALSVLDITPSGSSPSGSSPSGSTSSPSSSSPLHVALNCLNQSPENPFKNPDKVVGHVVLLSPPAAAAAAAAAAEDGETALRALAAVFSKLQVSHVLVATSSPNADVITALLATQQQQQQQPPTAAAAAAAAVQHLPAASGPEVWRRAVDLAAVKTGGATTGSAVQYGNVLVLLDEQAHAAAVWAALGLEAPAAATGPLLRVSPGGLSVCEFSADPAVTPATVRCINNTAHL
ncbi:hypothetical protein HYH02_013952 [Chlamydomonas schloesseri]|uniref:Phosphoglycerate mutase n=1 Tax=Chlamydomonas schloesseri TaxID=2026947 RepID=A0A835SWS9_9CHLO|nr:hypothetical protein HYH02_013952 [Chlamydomonas schloesseri]|eukprot:KAG2429694.1 hypothetical protein HYH02_013952 [Chlamydomonas schloesseri]